MHKDAQDTLLQQWRLLLTAVHEYEAELGGVAPFRNALERAYTQALLDRRRQHVARAAAKEATRALQESLATAYDAGASLRHFIKSVLGFRTLKLLRFGINPRVKRARSSKKPVVGFESPS